MFGVKTLARVLLSSALVTLFLTLTHQEQALQTISQLRQSLFNSAGTATKTAANTAGETHSAVSLYLRSSKIKATFFFDRHLNGYHLKVHQDKGKAVLAGTVSTAIEKNYAEQLALGIQGIDQVDNTITVDTRTIKTPLLNGKKSQGSKVNDQTITAKIQATIAKNKYLRETNISIKTQDKVITLTGEAASKLEKDLIEKLASNIDHVQDVHNRIQITANQ